MRNLLFAAALLVSPALVVPAAHAGEPTPAKTKPAAKKRATQGRKEPPAKPAAGDKKPAPDKATPASAAPTAPAASAARPTAAEAVAKMQKFYEATADLHAKFEQELTMAMGGKKKASGDVWLKKPGRMRWEYQKPEKKLMVADGKNLWVYEPEDEQAFRQSLDTSTLPSSVAFLFGQGKLEAEFTITEERPQEGAGEPSDLVLKLVPTKPTAQYRYLFFVVDPGSFMVKETLVYDQQGGLNRMRFRDVETNKGVANGKFEFSPPPGTKILKM